MLKNTPFKFTDKVRKNKFRNLKTKLNRFLTKSFFKIKYFNLNITPYFFIVGGGAVIFLATAILLLIHPIAPEISYRFNKIINPQTFSPQYYDNKYAGSNLVNITDKSTNRIIMPTIATDVGIYTGANSETLNKGAWIKPNGKTPDLVGNIIITGHRFSSIDDNMPFYHLDKIKTGDPILVIWHGQEYKYIVSSSVAVSPNDTAIENQSSIKMLTIYTCEGSDAAQRRVLIAYPFSNQQEA